MNIDNPYRATVTGDSSRQRIDAVILGSLAIVAALWIVIAVALWYYSGMLVEESMIGGLRDASTVEEAVDRLRPRVGGAVASLLLIVIVPGIALVLCSLAYAVYLSARRGMPRE